MTKLFNHLLLKCGSYFADLLKYGTSGEYEILVVHLYPDMLRKIYKQEIPSFVKDAENRPFIHKTGAQSFIQQFVEGIYYYLDNPDLVNDELLELKVKELLLLLVQANNGASIASLFSDLFTPREVSIKEAVDNHLFSGISIEDLASLSNLSVIAFQTCFKEVGHFSRSFKAVYHCSPSAYRLAMKKS